VTLGAKTSLTGKGSIDEDIQGASYKVGAKAGGIPVFSHSGDACKPDTIKLPLGLGEIDMKGFSCPLKAGAAELDLDLTLSANIPAKMAKTDISLTAAASSGDKVLCVDIKTSPAMMQGVKDFSNLTGLKKVETEVGSESGTLKLNWSDCGDSSTHGHITALTPDTVTLGAKTSLTGKGSIDEDIQGASYKVGAKAGGIPVFSHSGDACKPDTIKLPLGLGEIDMKGFSCPLKAGAAELDLDLTLSANIPAKMAKTDISLTAAASSGDKVLCVDIKTSPATMPEIVV